MKKMNRLVIERVALAPNRTYQAGKVVPSFTLQFLWVPKALNISEFAAGGVKNVSCNPTEGGHRNILDVRDQMFRICLEDDVYQERHKGIGPFS